LDDFDIPADELSKSIDILLNDKKAVMLQEDSNASEEILNNLSVDLEEVIDIIYFIR